MVGRTHMNHRRHIDTALLVYAVDAAILEGAAHRSVKRAGDFALNGLQVMLTLGYNREYRLEQSLSIRMLCFLQVAGRK